MAATFSVELEGEGHFKDLARLGPFMKEAQRRTVVRGGQQMATRYAQAVSGEVLHVRSGALRDSIGSTPVAEVGGAMEVRTSARFGPAAPYAAIHEFGGTIRPKGHPYLTIPIGENENASGVARYASPYDVPGDTGWIHPKGHNPLFVRFDENDEIEPFFVGVTESVIPDRHPLEKSFDAVQPIYRQIAQEEFDRAVGEALGE